MCAITAENLVGEFQKQNCKPLKILKQSEMKANTFVMIHVHTCHTRILLLATDIKVLFIYLFISQFLTSHLVRWTIKI